MLTINDKDLLSKKKKKKIESMFPARTPKTSNQIVVSNVYRVLIGRLSSTRTRLMWYPRVLLP